MCTRERDCDPRHNSKAGHVFENFLIATSSFKDEYIYQYQEIDKRLGQQLIKFCYPFALHSPIEPDSATFTCVLTDENGLQQFAYCRHIKEHSSSSIVLCFCLLSYSPAVEFMEQLLDVLIDLWDDSLDLVRLLLDQLHAHRMPGPGQVVVLEPKKGRQCRLQYPNTTGLPSLPSNPHLVQLYNSLAPQQLLTLVVSLLYERRVLLISSRLSALSGCALGLSLLLYPLHWQHILVPVLHGDLLDYLTAPMPYLLGVHRSHMKTVRRLGLEEVVVADLDTGQVQVWTNDVATLPSELTATITAQIRRPNTQMDDNLARVFLDLFLLLFGNYASYIVQRGPDQKGPPLQLDRATFVNAKGNDLKPFLSTFVELQMFHQFIDNRIDLLTRPGPDSPPVTTYPYPVDSSGNIILYTWWVDQALFEWLWAHGQKGTDTHSMPLRVLQSKVEQKVREGRERLRPLQERVQTQIREQIEKVADKLDQLELELAPSTTHTAYTTNTAIHATHSTHTTTHTAHTTTHSTQPPPRPTVGPTIKPPPVAILGGGGGEENNLLISFDGAMNSPLVATPSCNSVGALGRDLMDWDQDPPISPTTGVLVPEQAAPPSPLPRQHSTPALGTEEPPLAPLNKRSHSLSTNQLSAPTANANTSVKPPPRPRTPPTRLPEFQGKPLPQLPPRPLPTPLRQAQTLSRAGSGDNNDDSEEIIRPLPPPPRHHRANSHPNVNRSEPPPLPPRRFNTQGQLRGKEGGKGNGEGGAEAGRGT